MTISAVNGTSQPNQQNSQPASITQTPAATSFEQELDSQSAQTGTPAVHHRHHHHAASQSVTSSAATAASAAGGASTSTVASLLTHLPS